MPRDIANVTEIIDERPLGAFQKRLAALCGVVVFAEGFNTQSVGYVAPALRQAWGFSARDVALFIGIGLVGLMLGATLLAPVADRIGRRPLLLACVPFLGVCALLTAISPTVPMLDGFRFLTGLGIGGALPNAIALTSEYSPHRRRSLLVALMFTGFVLGALAGGLVAAWLVPPLGWRSVFFVGGGLALLLAPLLFAALPESIRFLALKGSSRDLVVNLLRHLDPHLAIDGHTRFVVEGGQVSGVQVLALFRGGRALTTLLIWTIYFMSLVDLFIITSWLTTTVNNLGVTVFLAIMVTVVFQVGGVVGTAFGWLADKIGPSTSLTMAYLIGATSIAGIGLAGADLALLMLTAFGAGVGILGGQTVANSTAAIAYPTEIRSTGVGWATGIGRMGSILGPSVTGILLSMNVASQHIFFLAAIPALLAATAAAALGRVQGPFAIAKKVPA
jgi:AAHS family 4-hydroxybenzoate transporter-like MFS transporter